VVLNNFDDINLFTKVAQLCSYTKAANQMDIPLPTLSRRIKALEESLGVKLINRDTRKLSLTEAGVYLYEASNSLLIQLSDIEHETSNYRTTPAGDLKITVPVEVSINLLNDIISDFAVLYPQINIDVYMTNEVVDIINSGYDLAIRGGALKDSNLVSKKLMSSRLLFCCSQEYIDRCGLLDNPHDADQHTFITYRYGFYQNLKLLKGGDEVILNPNNRMMANSFDYLLKCSQKGLGIAVLPASICYEQIIEKELIPLMKEWSAPEVALYGLYPGRVKTKKLELFLDYLGQRLKMVEDKIMAL
jgi:DNA-binding transcriptional LysR family regulator